MDIDRQAFDLWIQSDQFDQDLAAVRRVFATPRVGRRSALYIYFMLAAIPDLLAVEFGNADRMRTAQGIARDLARTKQFYESIVGDDGRPGLQSPDVQATITHVGRAHAQYAGMEPWMMAAMGHVIGLAPIRSAASDEFAADDAACFVRYMDMAWSLMGTSLPRDLDDVRRDDGQTVLQMVARSEHTAGIIERFQSVMAARYGLVEADSVMGEVAARLPSAVADIIEPIVAQVVGNAPAEQ